MEAYNSISQALQNWLQMHSIGRRPRAAEFNREIVGVLLRSLPDVSRPAQSLDLAALLAFAPSIAHYCPARWNAMVSALRFVSPAAKALERRPLGIRHFTPPGQIEFQILLLECDRSTRSAAGLVVRFLAFTGLRIAEAKALQWTDVFEDRIEVPAEVSKGNKRRSVPLLVEVRHVLERLRALDSGGFVLPRENARKAIASACRRARVAPMSHHCFRHLFATRCIESGVDVPTVARWLGHRDGGALLGRTYFHLLDEHSRLMAARVKIAA